MTSFKIVIGLKDGACVQKEVQEVHASALLGKKIGDTIKGMGIGFEGYEFLLTGGSDNCGFPMRKEINGTGRKRIFAMKGVGLRKTKGKGIRARKTVCGNTVHEKIVQVNLKILKEGSTPLAEPKAKEAPTIEEKKEAPIDVSKE